MIRNFFTTAWRSMRRQGGYTLLNIIGLTIGISASLLILLFLNQQLSFDQHHENGERIIRISSEITEPDDSFRWSVTQSPLGPELQRRFPEVEKAVRFIGNGRVQFERDDKTFFEEKFFSVDTTVFDIFTFDFIVGNPASALSLPEDVVLTRSVAERVFGTEDMSEVMGKTLTVGEEQEFRVTGVYEDMPVTSHLIANGLHLISDTEGRMEAPQAWGGFYLYTYALLTPGTSQEAFEGKLSEVNDEFVRPIFDQFDVTVKYETIALTDIHLKSTFQGEPEPTGSMDYIYIFAAIGVFLLVLACINYMNLATARSQRRAREVGVRKTMGAYRNHLIWQFLAESFLLALIALAVSLAVVYLSIPFFNQILDLPLSFGTLWQPMVLIAILGILTLTGLVAGSYPAFYLSGFHPAHVLKGTSGKSTGGNRRLRQGLVVVQFSISLFMLVSTGIVYDQLKYLDQKDLGFTQNPVIQFSISNVPDRQKWPVLQQKLESISGVQAAATTSSVPGQGYGKNLMPVETEEGQMIERGVDHYAVDYDYFPTMEMEVVKGRNFDRARGLDSASSVMVNEAMVRRLGWSDPIGKEIILGSGEGAAHTQVIGVIKDFHQQSLYEVIPPLMFTRGQNLRMQVVRIEGDNIEKTLASVQSTWEEIFPTTPFEYEFQDEAFFEQYEADRHRSQLFTLFSGLTVLIACLGLLGLASYTAEQRTREMGIRKIVGASVPQLVQLMTREFLILVLVATPIAFGAAYYFMKGWLDDFAYHADMKVLTFVLSLLITLVITLATTSYHAFRAASINPATALRQE